MTKPLPIPTSSDWVFKRIFGDERHIESLQALLQTVLDLPEGELKSIQLLNPYTKQECADDKYAVLDIRLETAYGKVINVEIQVARDTSFHKRILYYLSKMISEQVRKGDGYDKIKKVISITILDHELIAKSAAYHHQFRLLDEKNGVFFDDIIELHTLELPKLPAAPDGTKLWDWLAFFKSKDEAELDALAQSNREVAKVVGVYKEMTAERRGREERYSREKAEMDYYAGMASAKQEGLEEGLEKLNEAARNALAMGLDLTDIAKITGLDIEEIERLHAD